MRSPSVSPVAADDHWMRHALDLARRGAEAGEVPVGAVVVRDGVVLGEGWNRPIGEHDPSAHAEMVALRAAARAAANYRLAGATLYVTMEPCPMCAGAIVHARVARLVYGAADEKWGACGSVMQVLEPGRLNHDVTIPSSRLSWNKSGLENTQSIKNSAQRKYTSSIIIANNFLQFVKNITISKYLDIVKNVKHRRYHAILRYFRILYF